jgi:hypothetical protein
MRKPPTGEPCAGELHAGFEGRRGRKPLPTSITESNFRKKLVDSRSKYRHVGVGRANEKTWNKVFGQRMRVEDPETVKSTYGYFAPRFSFPPRVNLSGVRDMFNLYAEQKSKNLLSRGAGWPVSRQSPRLRQSQRGTRQANATQAGRVCRPVVNGRAVGSLKTCGSQLVNHRYVRARAQSTNTALSEFLARLELFSRSSNRRRRRAFYRPSTCACRARAAPRSS